MRQKEMVLNRWIRTPELCESDEKSFNSSEEISGVEVKNLHAAFALVPDLERS
jgi:hypothetical protein